MHPVPAAVLAALAVLAVLLARRVRALTAELAELAEQVDGLSSRLAVAEQDVAGALERTEVAETVLLDKGLADEEDLEAARRRPGSSAGDVTGELN